MRFLRPCPSCGSKIDLLKWRQHVCSPKPTPTKQKIPELPSRHSKFGAYTSAGVCSCDGANPNCIYCSGTGLISKDVRQHKDATGPHGTATIDFDYVPPSEEEVSVASSAAAATDIPDENVSPEAVLGYEHPKDATRMDKMRNYGYPCRETGRYGSHPSHDGFDDESQP